MDFIKHSKDRYIVVDGKDNTVEVADIKFLDNEWWFQDRDIWEYTKNDMKTISDFMQTLL